MWGGALPTSIQLLFIFQKRFKRTIFIKHLLTRQKQLISLAESVKEQRSLNWSLRIKFTTKEQKEMEVQSYINTGGNKKKK